jgi:hypothetical protein
MFYTCWINNVLLFLFIHDQLFVGNGRVWCQIENRRVRLTDSFLWIGLLKSFERAGFKIMDRTSENRPMVRFCCIKEGEDSSI